MLCSWRVNLTSTTGEEMSVDKRKYNLFKTQSNIRHQNIFIDSYPTQIHFLMIDKCNVKCIMCGGDYFKSKTGRAITLDKFKKMAVNLRFDLVSAIVLAGAGEPLLNKDLVPIIQFVRSSYPHVNISVTTNGIGLTQDISEKLINSNVNVVNISINSSTRSSYKRIMQIDGFDAVCKNARKFVELRNLAKKPIALQFSSALNRLNIEELPRLVELGREIGINGINVFYTRFYPERIRHANVDDPADRLDDSASLFYHQELSDSKVLQAKDLALKIGIGFSHEPLFREHAGAVPCNWAMNQLMVGFDGEIYPCGGSEVHFREKVEGGVYDFGNALHEPIDAFWNNELYRALRHSSRQGSECLLPECRCCANVCRPNDIKAHIMQWDQDESGSIKQKPCKPCEGNLNLPVASSPLVSVIVSTYNRPDQLAGTLRSILGQTYKNIEIVVVNDCGVEVENIVSFLNKENRITYVRHKKNKGLAAARNTGIKLAHGKYIAYLDDDDLYYPDHIETLVQLLESNSDYKAAYTDAHRAYQVNQNGVYVVTKRDVPYSFDFDYDRILQTNFVPVLCFLHERTCFDDVGFFDENLKRLEDWDLWIRLSRSFKIAHIKKVTCEFSWRTDGTTMTSGQEQEFVKAREQIAQKYRSLQSASASQAKFQKPATKNLVSIVILTLNQLPYTQECVASIKKHTFEPHEIIFVDNASNDGTVEWLQGLVDGEAQYSLIKNENNFGFARGCNQGIKEASGEFILLLNNDVVVTDGWLSGLLECFEGEDGVGIVGPMTNNISGIQKVRTANYPTLDDLPAYAISFREMNRFRRLETRRIVGFCMLFRRNLVEQIGLLDESFGTGNFEDDDYCLRATLAGYRNVIAGDVFIHHYGSVSFLGNKVNYKESITGNRKIFINKWNQVDSNSESGRRFLLKDRLENAKILAQKDQLQDAIDGLMEFIRVFPQNDESFVALAETLAEIEQFELAQSVIEKLTDVEENVRGLEILCRCKEQFKLYEEAAKLADRVLTIKDDSPVALNCKGVVAYNNGKNSTAEICFRDAIEKAPSYGISYTNLGLLLWNDEKQQEAVRLLERGFILSPTQSECFSNYHVAISTLQDFMRAEIPFRDAVSLYPQHKKLSFLLIELLLQLCKHEEAMTAIEAALNDFGLDDGLLAAALQVRGTIGPLVVAKDRAEKGAISLCMIVKNEEKHLGKALFTVKPLVDEMIVVDTGSEDRTKDIATVYGAKVYDFQWKDDFSAARNYALSKASGEWVLILDADEVISPIDFEILRKIVSKKGSKPKAYSFVTRNYIIECNRIGRKPNDGKYPNEEAGAGWTPSSKVRLFPNQKDLRFSFPVHELIEPAIRQKRMKIADSGVPVHHYGNLDLDKTRRKGEHYYDIGKKKLEDMGTSDLRALQELAIQAVNVGKYEEAIELWKQLISHQPDNAGAYICLGTAYNSLDNFLEAREAHATAFKLAPQMPEALTNYIRSEMYLGNAEIALATFEQSKINEDIDESTLFVMAAVYSCCKQQQKAIACFERLLQVPALNGRTGLSIAIYELLGRLRAAGQSVYASEVLKVALAENFLDNDLEKLREIINEKPD